MTSDTNLVEDVNVVVGEVKLQQAWKAPERPLSDGLDTAPLQAKLGQVLGVFEGIFRQFPKIIILQVQFHCDLISCQLQKQHIKRLIIKLTSPLIILKDF